MCGLFRSPAIPPGLSMHECGASGSASHHLVASTSRRLATSPLCPGCPSVPPGLSVQECGAAGSASHHLVGSASCSHLTGSAIHCLAVSPLHPSCPSLPLLPVWMNVSSLSPWLLDFHTVRFSVSSGCFLFLNCCPSFGCARRHSVSTYASILSGSPILGFVIHEYGMSTHFFRSC